MIQGGHRGTPHPDLVRKSGFFKAIVDGALLIAAVKSGGASAWMGGIFCGEGPGASAAEVVTGKEHQKPTEFFLDEFFVWAGLSPRERQILLDAVQYIKAIFHIHNISKMFPPAVKLKAPKPPLRLAYEAEVKDLAKLRDSLRAQGKSSEEIARAMHEARRQLGIKYKDMTPPDILKRINERNIVKYGDPLGPTIEYFIKQNRTWDQIIETSISPGPWPPW